MHMTISFKDLEYRGNTVIGCITGNSFVQILKESMG